MTDIELQTRALVVGLLLQISIVKPQTIGKDQTPTQVSSNSLEIPWGFSQLCVITGDS